MGFLIKAEKIKVLKEIVETLSGIVDETELIISEKGVKIVAMNPGRICLLQILIPKSGFQLYEHDTKKEKVVLSLEDLNKILKRGTPNDSIEIEYLEDIQKIKIKLQRKNNSRLRTFSLGLLESEIENIPMASLLNIEHESKINIDLNTINEAVKDAEIYGNVITFETDADKGVKFSASGQIGDMEYIFGLEDIESDIKESCSATFGIEFLKKILKIAPITNNIELLLKTEHPLRINFFLEDGAIIDFFLAPRVEDQTKY